MVDYGTINLHSKSVLRIDFIRRRLLKKLEVLLDGQAIDCVFEDKKISFKVLPGRHTVQIKWYRWRSQEIGIDSIPNTTVSLEWGAKQQYLKQGAFEVGLILIAIFCSLAFRNAFGTILNFALLIVAISHAILHPIPPEVYYLKRVED